jgi:oxygen-independent coproporphyrinogen-3 oxidase
VIQNNSVESLIEALKKEIDIQKDYLSGETISTIYIGGGTPSLLKSQTIFDIFQEIKKFHRIEKKLEFTVEINPDDVDLTYLKEIREYGVNRISIGVQSFNDEDLKLLNRRHTSEQSFESVQNSVKAGFENISIDLIYGIPGTNGKIWNENIKSTLDLPIQHISAYHLTIEPETKFAELLKSGKIKLMDEEQSVEQFRNLVEQMASNNYIHYEISNFCQENFYSIHNTNYWKQKNYLGLGPSAHSFNGSSRQWNTSDHDEYIQQIGRKKAPCRKEILDEKTRYNEYILTSLRTMWGADLKYIEETFSKEASDYCISLSNRFIDYGMLERKGDFLLMTQQGKFISDNIVSELLMVN